MKLLIISGISGSGKSMAINALEDIGYYCIDNLPPQLLLPVSRLIQGNVANRNLAVVIDSRSKEMFESLSSELDTLNANNIRYQLVFIYAEKEVILNRYKQTRRKHPLISDQIPTLQEAIEKEYELCRQIQNRADTVIDTTRLTSTRFRNTIIETFKLTDYEGMTVKLISFGYRNGIPNEADIVYDVRCMPNPFYIEELKPLSGLDDEVYDYVFSFAQSVSMGEKMVEFLSEFLPYYQQEGKSELVVAIGCTSGHHRSVSFTRYLQQQLNKLNYEIITVHRDIEKAF